ncbi:hypothetical protein CDAR_98581 [Caerostris darwini]|uniref:Uncharacterized protein n=1 Tax=Caerostris darwini TaxID=1538125 RepID=A0AAV4UFR7_9ARAC|nr:hypothetical protein CDAR_98581 [Caerostris darwini]
MKAVRIGGWARLFLTSRLVFESVETRVVKLGEPSFEDDRWTVLQPALGGRENILIANLRTRSGGKPHCPFSVCPKAPCAPWHPARPLGPLSGAAP